MIKVLITGATGLLGSNLAKVAAEEYNAEVIACIHRTKPVEFLPCTKESLDITDKQGVFRSIRKHDPDVVIHCAALVDAAFLEKNCQVGWRIFVEATENIALACQQIKTKLIFVSTDWVFDGLNPPYQENSIPYPINHYGVLKVVGETVVRSLCQDWAIARVAAVYGLNKAIPTPVPEKPYGFGSLVNHFLKKFQAGEKIREWKDCVNVKANPTLASDAADALMAIYARNQKGIFHCCGRECISRVDLAEKVAEIFDFDKELISTSFREKTDLAKWIGKDLRLPRQTCLDATWTEKRLGRENLGVGEGLVQFRKEIEENEQQEERE